MSLSKSYAVDCEANLILIRRDDEAHIAPDVNRPQRVANLAKCARSTSPQFTAREARRVAKAAGWIRHAESFPLYYGAAEDDRSRITFDVCPACAPLVTELPSLPVRTAGEAEAVAGLERNRATVVPTPPLPDVHCLECDASLTTEAGLWVDKLSGDHGGTYDRCPVAADKNHRPAR